MAKYRVVKFKSNKFGIQKRYFCGLIWSIIGENHIHNDGLVGPWCAYTWDTLDEATMYLIELVNKKNEYKIDTIYQHP